MLREDGRSIQDDFAATFCADNGLTAVQKAFWLSKGDRTAGSIVVFLASADEARALMQRRLVKVAGQVAFVGEFHRMPRPIRCYNYNQYGHYQSRCQRPTTCGRCAQDHRTDSCTSREKKCAACAEAHAVTNRRCPVYNREKARVRQGEQQPNEPTQTSERYV